MKENIITLLFYSICAFSFTTYGQIELFRNDDPDIPYGLQNKHGTADTNNADISVLILANETAGNWVEDVEFQLESTGLIAADTFVYVNDTPESSLINQYDAVFLFAAPNTLRPRWFTTLFLPYLRAGGAIVDAPIIGSINENEFASVMRRGKSKAAPFLSLGTIFDASHPILENIETINGGPKSYHNAEGILSTGTEIIAEWSNGEPLVIIKEDVFNSSQPRAFINIFPPSGNANDNFWDVNSDVALLMINAIKWVVTTDTENLTTSSNIKVTKKEMSVFPNPGKNTISVSNISGNLITKLQVLDITGRIVTSLQPTSIEINELDISYLQKGSYFLQLQTESTKETLRFEKY